MYTIRKVYLAMVLFAALCMTMIAVAEDKTPVGTVHIDETQFAAILGGSTGGGTLRFNGQEYAFSTGGMSLGASVGVAKISLSGDVYDMTDVSQFPGTYRKFTAAIALAGGGAALHLKNENGVRIKLSGTTKGISLDLSGSGMSIKMK